MVGYSRESVGLIGSEVRRVGLGDHVCMPFVSAETRTTALVQFVAAGLQRRERVIVAASQELHGVLLGALVSEGWNAGALVAADQVALLSNEQAFGEGPIDAEAVVGMLRQGCAASRKLGFSGFRAAGHPPVAHAASLLAFETGVCDLHRNEPSMTTLCLYSKAQTDPQTLRDVIAVHPQVLLGDRLCNNSFFDPNAFRDDRPANDARQLDWMIHQLLRSRDPDEESQVTDAASLRLEIEHYRRAAVNLSRGIDLRDRVFAMLARQTRGTIQQFAAAAKGSAVDHQEATERLTHLSSRLDALAELVTTPTALQPRTVDVGGLLSDCIARISQQAEPGSGPITLKTEGSVLGRLDVEATTLAIEHALRLALRHGCGGAVAVGVQKHGQVARISIRYHGLDGMGAAAALSGSTGNQELYDWLGIDLFQAREVVRRMNGVLSVASWPDDAVVFTIELPRNTPSSFGDVFS